VDVRVNISDTTANAVAAKLDYSVDTLAYVGGTVNSGVWGVTATNTGGQGSIDIEVGTFTRVSGDQLVASLVFKVTAEGTTSLTFDAGSAVVDATTNENLLPAGEVSTSKSADSATASPGGSDGFTITVANGSSITSVT
jgi:hypothetical protein